MHWWLVILAWNALMSVVTFVMYAWDKRQARRNEWRVPETTLQVLALLGGWPGAHVGRAVFQHKTRKRGFTVVLWAITVLHVMLLLLIVLPP